MPTYSYMCKECGDQFDIVQSFADDALKTCAKCGGDLRKLFNSVGVVFKGSGFYRNDSRSNANTTAESKTESQADSKSESPSKSTSESKPKPDTKTEAKSDKKAATKAST